MRRSCDDSPCLADKAGTRPRYGSHSSRNPPPSILPRRVACLSPLERASCLQGMSSCLERRWRTPEAARPPGPNLGEVASGAFPPISLLASLVRTYRHLSGIVEQDHWASECPDDCCHGCCGRDPLIATIPTHCRRLPGSGMQLRITHCYWGLAP